MSLSVCIVNKITCAVLAAHISKTNFIGTNGDKQTNSIYYAVGLYNYGRADIYKNAISKNRHKFTMSYNFL